MKEAYKLIAGVMVTAGCYTSGIPILEISKAKFEAAKTKQNMARQKKIMELKRNLK